LAEKPKARQCEEASQGLAAETVLGDEVMEEGQAHLTMKAKAQH